MAFPFTESDIAVRSRGKIGFTVPVRAHGVIYLDITEREFEGDRGYTYGRRF